MILSFMIFFSGLLSLVLVRKHYLMSLLSLEYLLLSIYFLMYFYFIFFFNDFYFIIVFLVMGVCEGVLGLSLIVFLARKFSLDFINSLSCV
uniref:NADH-ubiquinone oxidoreductase chain 4L n=1 Tax=Metcalfa pruinosa TaxID=1185500 RepID=A0A8F2TDT4_9HEMI|nr:NADH dehydrogenase subunit 4L [Metcalfa pruinosa]QWV61027.1 NADH dehydrogenase subunit 4L [Metcalfa pruinosa]WAR47342.1 NADH dehydrogenase subunit 4L [Metcalfa pruinosa]